MVVVKNPNDIYKPEYSITQLLTEWIISNNNSENKKKRFMGFDILLRFQLLRHPDLNILKISWIT